MRAALYARVSTTDQNNEIQLRELEAYRKARGWIPAQIESDQASGAKARRPGLDSVMQMARERKIDVVLVWKLDRFGRSTRDLLNNLQELESLGVRFIAVSQGIDTDQSNPISRFLLTILAGVAELEREMIRERQAAGIANRRNKGLFMGRPPKIFRRDLVLELRAKGCSIRHIAQELKIPRSTVYDFLMSEKMVPVWPFDQNAKDGNPRDLVEGPTA